MKLKMAMGGSTQAARRETQRVAAATSDNFSRMDDLW